ncbi:ATP-dependent RNA helicase DOB1 [Rhizoctonia solani]|uniref:ATP-dependent RNA helicase DOB1 n=1 Tax=Rhizoctonia solani TaxID=456999 RepID=A0A8H8NWM1_9AGAM|nr:ATP-dependent RNA helicase DOB1 [Rhizoctonia solani]QRW20905.1 ATP-dependent RNA helicase DOB1 [Rhizoctonia solani]
MALSSIPVRELELYSTGLNLGTSREWSTPRGFLLELTTALPHLIRLEVMLRNEGERELVDTLTEAVHNFITHLKDLQCFVIKTNLESSPSYTTYLTEREEVQLCRTWRSSCSDLNEVEYLSGRRWKLFGDQWLQSYSQPYSNISVERPWMRDLKPPRATSAPL